MRKSKNVRFESAGTLRHAGIAETIGQEILSGTRKSGSRIVFEQIAKRFGVSRVVLREVIKTLSAKGMVASKTRVGTVVMDPSLWNWVDADVLKWRVGMGLDGEFLDHLADVRRGIEPIGAALVARNHNRKELARLRACIQAMRDCEGDTQRYSEADVAFHVTVAEISGNPLLRSFNAVITVALRGLMNLTARGVKAAEKNHAGATGRHEKIVKAIEKRDEIAAAQAMLKVIAGGQRFAKYRAK